MAKSQPKAVIVKSTDLKRQFSEVIEEAVHNGDRIVITSYGHAVGVFTPFASPKEAEVIRNTPEIPSINVRFFYTYFGRAVEQIAQVGGRAVIIRKGTNRPAGATGNSPDYFGMFSLFTSEQVKEIEKDQSLNLAKVINSWLPPVRRRKSA